MARPFWHAVRSAGRQIVAAGPNIPATLEPSAARYLLEDYWRDQTEHEAAHGWREAGRYWNANAEAWTSSPRRYDVYRTTEHARLPRHAADVARPIPASTSAGRGHKPGLLARLGARLAAVDIAETFIRYASEAEQQEPLGILLPRRHALDLPSRMPT